MDPNAVLGPVDPQIGDLPAGSIVKLLELKKPAAISDEMLILVDIAAKARLQVAVFVAEVLAKHLPRDKAAALATALTEGRWTHDFPITVELARQIGLAVSTNMPRTVYDLMDLYPQGGKGRPSVLYVPLRPMMPNRGETPIDRGTLRSTRIPRSIDLCRQSGASHQSLGSAVSIGTTFGWHNR